MSGINSQRLGKTFETQIEIICTFLNNQKIACIAKVPVEKTIVRDRKSMQNKMAYIKRSTVDFIGYWYNDARHICFDAKCRLSSINSVTIGNNDQSHQIEYLYNAHKAGADAFLLVKAKGDRIFKVRPDESWKEARAVKINFKNHTLIDWNAMYDFLQY